MGSLMIVLLTHCCLGDKIEKNEMGRACSAYGCEYRVLVGKPEEGDHLGDPGLDGRKLLRWIFR